MPSREETSLLVSDSTIQGLHIKQENGVRGTFTLPLVNTPDQNTRPAGGQTSSSVATDTHAVVQDVISQEKGFDLEGRGWGDSSRVSGVYAGGVC